MTNAYMDVILYIITANHLVNCFYSMKSINTLAAYLIPCSSPSQQVCYHLLVELQKLCCKQLSILPSNGIGSIFQFRLSTTIYVKRTLISSLLLLTRFALMLIYSSLPLIQAKDTRAFLYIMLTSKNLGTSLNTDLEHENALYLHNDSIHSNKFRQHFLLTTVPPASNQYAQTVFGSRPLFLRCS